MAALTALQRLMASPKTARFVETLRHADLPTGWADDPEIVGMASAAYKELGTGSPFWKATFGNQKPEVFTHTTDGIIDDSLKVAAPFDEFKPRYGGMYFRKGNDWGADEVTFGGAYPYTYEVYLNAPKALDLRTPPKGQKTQLNKELRAMFDKDERADIKAMNGLDSWDPAQSFWDGDLYIEAGRDSQNRVMEKLRKTHDADGVLYNDNSNYGSGGQSMVVFDPRQIKSVSNRGTFNPADPNIYRGLIPMLAGGGALAAMSPGSAQAAEAEWPKQGADGRLIWPADMPGYRNTEPGLEAPLVDPVDIATAPIGMTTAAGKALAMAAEPGLAYGTDKALGALLGLFQRNRRTGGGGGV